MKKIVAEIQALENRLGAETGPRGGKVIGKTKSGKAIYDTPEHPHHKNFSTQDHYDAAQTHEAARLDAPEKDKPDMAKKINKHYSLAQSVHK